MEAIPLMSIIVLSDHSHRLGVEKQHGIPLTESDHDSFSRSSSHHRNTIFFDVESVTHVLRMQLQLFSTFGLIGTLFGSNNTREVTSPSNRL